MPRCLFCTDLHGHLDRYQKLFALLDRERPDALFLGGDLLPSPGERTVLPAGHTHFVDYLEAEFVRCQQNRPQGDGPLRVFLILGNDDGRFEEDAFRAAAARGVWDYAHGRAVPFADLLVFGYSYVPPSPFHLKDWERYDVSRYVDPGCVAPEDGRHSVPVSEHELVWTTIQADLDSLAAQHPMDRAVFLFHAPPYRSSLDRAALDGQMIDHVPLDVHVGSIAIQRFIDARQPLLTLHGHIHESTRLTGSWRDQKGRTNSFGAAHDGPELAVVRFDTDDLATAERELV